MRASLIHGKTLTLPVCGRTKLTQLLYDTSAVLFSPLPAFFQELFTCQICLVDSLLLQTLDYLNFCCNRSMVCTRLP